MTQELRYTVDEAFDYCGGVTASHYENFPVASLFLPEEKRPYIQAIYAFSRIADDFSDESDLSPGERLRKLDDWEAKLLRCYEGNADHPVFIALRETISRSDIPIEPLRDLLTAFRRDVTQNRYETFEDLLGYCTCSANPVGRLVLMVFGYRDDALHRLSDAVCTALQLANFWQDVDVDRSKNRLYIPLEDFRRFGVTPEQWGLGAFDENFRRLLKFEVVRTRQLFYQGSELPSLVDRDLRIELRLVWFGGMAVLDRIEKVNSRGVRRRPILRAGDKVLILLRGLFVRDLSLYRRKPKPWDPT